MPKLRNLHKLLDPEIRAKNLRVVRERMRGAWWDFSGQQMPAPVFLIGCSRSGTTVSYETLAASSELISIGYELPQFWDGLWGPAHNGWESEAATAEAAIPAHRDAFFRFFYSRVGKGRILDKTCINILRAPYLQALFPEAHFVYLYRDGRANVSSLIDGWENHGHFGLSQFLGESPVPVAIDDGRFREWSFFLPPGWRDYNNASLEQVCAFQWVKANEMALEARNHVPPAQWTEIRYEDLLDQPVANFERVFGRLGLDFDQRLRELCGKLAERPTSMVSGVPDRDKWKKRNGERVERVMPQLTPMLQRLGYDA
ncbi:MAG: sulfotransferase [Gammaproteobacteria bacterium]|nr:sulfotransferase [Gammaproteobacteria bacterium]